MRNVELLGSMYISLKFYLETQRPWPSGSRPSSGTYNECGVRDLGPSPAFYELPTLCIWGSFFSEYTFFCL